MKANKLLYGLAMTPALACGQQSEKPNIIFVLCDDMGWGDLGCYGQQYISTPNIDRMAREGMQFMQAYCGSPVSAPSRASLMTGQHSGHTKIRGNKEYWNTSGYVYYNGNQDYKVVGQEPLDKNHVVLPEIMKDNGYTTAQFGKWAGGYEGSESTPDKRGVDETDEYFKRPQYSADMIHQKALEWIDKQDGKTPFYGLFTYTLPHAELAQPEDSIYLSYKAKFCEDKTWGGDVGSWYHRVTNTHAQFAGMITRLDAYMGEIMDKLKEKGFDENTILIFSSDNGPHEEGGADPTFFNRDGVLKGIKRSCNEGGIRVPFIVRWPGKVPAGVKNDHQLAFYDVMPTFCELIGIENYVEKYKRPQSGGKEDYFDGISFLPTLLGNDAAQGKHDYLYWELNPQIGVRQGNWKLIVRNGNCELYDLASDVHEDNNIASQYPEKLAELKAIVRQAHVDSSMFPITLPK